MSTTLTSPTLTPAQDARRYSWLFSVLLPLVAPAGVAAYLATGAGFWLVLPVLFYFGGLPFADYLFGEDRSNPDEAAVPALEADGFFRALVRLTVPVLWGCFLFNAVFLATHALPTGLWLATVIATSLLCGLGIMVGHELGHKKGKADRLFALAALALCGYGHFRVEHNRGHHRWVATPEDPASARMGESVWRFAFRELPGAFFRCWDLETERLEQAGKSEWSLGNEVLQGLLITAVLYGGLTARFGLAFLPTLLLIGFIGAFLLTIVNYIEHYGLLRRKLANGRYEPCQPQHSWNSNHVASNLGTFHLQRHSDHHANPTRSYQSLRDFPELPTLPSGYFGMTLVALVPPLWFALMDPLLVATVKGDASRINFVEAKRARLVKRFGLTDSNAGGVPA